jgi:integrase
LGAENVASHPARRLASVRVLTAGDGLEGRQPEPRATWLTLRRTCSSWSQDKGVPGKVVAQLMGHANVDTMLNVYTQVLDGAVREAVEKVGGELFTIVHKPEWVAAKFA